MRQWRGARVAMIFQEPMTALNPTRRIGQQMVEVIRHHQALSRTDARQKAIALPRDANPGRGGSHEAFPV